MGLYRLLCVHPRRWLWRRLRRCRCMRSALMQKACSQVEEKWFIVRLTFCSLFYNSLTSSWTFVDTLLEPMFWFVDHFVRYLGPVSCGFILILRNMQCLNGKCSCASTLADIRVLIYLKFDSYGMDSQPTTNICTKLIAVGGYGYSVIFFQWVAKWYVLKKIWPRLQNVM